MAPTSNPHIPTLAPRTRDRLIDRVFHAASRRTLTIVVGPTGCGKSTLVPAALAEESNGNKILCTQPRRLAVVSVAQRVAQQCPHLQVGYHVGQATTVTSQTQVVFATAGILLEELRANGGKVFLDGGYECIIMDECHERSVESDLCLASIREFLRSDSSTNSTARIVLMSATFDHARYQQYFLRDGGCGVERIDVVTLETAESFATFYDRVTVQYLEDCIRLVAKWGGKNQSKYAQLREVMKRDPRLDLIGADSGRSFSSELLVMIGDLVRACHRKEMDNLAAPFLIFAPTYRQLEQIYHHILDVTNVDEAFEREYGRFDISVLHSSIDMEECMRSMQQHDKTHASTNHRRRRRILLASAIAESSITIPGVTVVIDTCRSLQVKYDGRKTSSHTVFSSRSICDQRKGRTGRTCAGTVYRLVPAQYYHSALPAYETPHLILSDCTGESMALLASAAKEMMQCERILLEACLDPPPAPVVKSAIQYLRRIGACFATTGQRSRLIATKYGALLAQLPFSIADAQSIVVAATRGGSYSMLLFRCIQTLRPQPIVHYFAAEYKSQAALTQYHPSVDPKDPIDVALAHMAAYMVWWVMWKTARRQAALRLFVRATTTTEQQQQWKDTANAGAHVDQDVVDRLVEAYDTATPAAAQQRKDCGVCLWTPAVDDVHVDWCRSHEINPTSVRSIADTMEVTRKIYFVAKFEPEWLRASPVDPAWDRPSDWKHLHEFLDDPEECSMLRVIFGSNCENTLRRSVEAIHTTAAATYEADKSSKERPACIHFLQGKCKYGDKCRSAHSLSAPRPMCKYFLAGTCTNGADCVFSHGQRQPANGNELNQKKKPIDAMRSCVPILQAMTVPNGPREWFKVHGSTVLFLGENNFSFSNALGSLGVSPAFMTDDKEIDTSSRRYFRLDASRICGGIDATRIHTYQQLHHDMARCNVQHFAWNFPFSGSEEDEAGNEDMIQATFLSLTVLTQLMRMPLAMFAIALQGDQLTRWSVLQSARCAGWYLKRWSKFDHSDFPGYRPSRSNGDPFPYDNGRFYVFQRQESTLC